VIVLDASAVLELLLRTAAAEAVERRVDRDPSLHAPSLLDLEVAQVIRRYWSAGEMLAERGSQAIADLAALPIRRYPHSPLLERVWELRAGITAYDAAYVALAETLHAPLVTRDRRLARTRGHRARIELV
jgi:predicted nucleic acid-binding protein